MASLLPGEDADPAGALSGPQGPSRPPEGVGGSGLVRLQPAPGPSTLSSLSLPTGTWTCGLASRQLREQGLRQAQPPKVQPSAWRAARTGCPGSRTQPRPSTVYGLDLPASATQTCAPPHTATSASCGLEVRGCRGAWGLPGAPWGGPADLCCAWAEARENRGGVAGAVLAASAQGWLPWLPSHTPLSSPKDLHLTAHSLPAGPVWDAENFLVGMPSGEIQGPPRLLASQSMLQVPREPVEVRHPDSLCPRTGTSLSWNHLAICRTHPGPGQAMGSHQKRWHKNSQESCCCVWAPPDFLPTDGKLHHGCGDLAGGSCWGMGSLDRGQAGWELRQPLCATRSWCSRACTCAGKPSSPRWNLRRWSLGSLSSYGCRCTGPREQKVGLLLVLGVGGSAWPLSHLTSAGRQLKVDRTGL